MNSFYEPIDYTQFSPNTVKTLKYLKVKNVFNPEKFKESKGFEADIGSIFIVADGFGSYSYEDKYLGEVAITNGTLTYPHINDRKYIFEKKCEATTSSGNECKRNAIRGKIFCWQHEKKEEEKSDIKEIETKLENIKIK
jgi:hypothetical protein